MNLFDAPQKVVSSSRRRGGHLMWWLVGCLTSLVLLAAYNNVPTALTQEDQALFADLHLSKNAMASTFDQQIAQIKEVQKLLFQLAPFGQGIPKREEREPSDLLTFGHGLCYDRSRALEKAMTYIGYQTRHVYLLYKDEDSLLKALVHRGQHSHAVTEVKTIRGWMLVDSIMPWVAVTREGHPIDAVDVWQRAGEFEDLPKYLGVPYWSIPGLYSRHGQFYPPFTAIPDVNWFDFITSAVI